MGALVLPSKLKVSKLNRALCLRIGIRFNGVERNDVHEYDVELGTIRTKSGEVFHGKVEPYWRR